MRLAAAAAAAWLPAALAALTACTVQVGVVPNNEPLVVFDPSTAVAGDPNSAYSGMLIDLLEYIIGYANTQAPFDTMPLRYTLEPPTSGSYGTLFANGSWDGLVGDLLANRTALAVADLTISSARVESGVSFLPPFMSSGSALLTQQTLQKPSVWRFLRPFTARLWWFLLLAIVWMGISMWLQDRCSPFSHRAWAKDPQGRRTLNLPNSSYITVMALLGKDAQEPRSVSSRLTFIGGVFLIFFILKQYSASLTTLVTVKDYSSLITGVTDLASQQLPFAAIRGSLNLVYLANSTDPTARALLRNVVPVASKEEAVSKLLAGDVYAFLDDLQSLRPLASMPPCTLQVVGQPLTNFYLAFGLQPATFARACPGLNATLVEPALTAAMVRALEQGKVSELFNQYFVSQSGTCDSSGGISSVADLDSIALQPNEMAGVTYIFMALVAIAWLMLLFECWAHKRKDHPALRRLNKSLGFVEPGTEERILRMHTERAQLRKAAISLRSLSQQAAAGGAAASSASQPADDTAAVRDATVVANALHAASSSSAAPAAPDASAAAGAPPAAPTVVATRLSTVMKGAVAAVRASSSLALPRVSMSEAAQLPTGSAAASGSAADLADAGASAALPSVAPAASVASDDTDAATAVAPEDAALRIAFRAMSSRISSSSRPLAAAPSAMSMATPAVPPPASPPELLAAAQSAAPPPPQPAAVDEAVAAGLPPDEGNAILLADAAAISVNPLHQDAVAERAAEQ